MDGEEYPPDDFRYNGEGKKNRCITWEHAEESFEAGNQNIRKVRSEIRSTIAQSNTQDKLIDSSRASHPQLRALNLRHESDVQS